METTVRTVKGITLFILTEDIGNILRIIKSLEKSGVKRLIDLMKQ